jgi:hypothetical protein
MNKLVTDNQKVRITWGDPNPSGDRESFSARYCIAIQELPRTPCKRKLRKTTLNAWYACDVLHLGAFLAVNLVRDCDFAETDTYEQARAKLEDAVTEAIRRTAESHPKCVEAVRQDQGLSLHEDELHYLKVVPEGVDPITVQAKDFSFTARWTGFKAYSPGSTMHYEPDGEPHYTLYESKSAGAARKLYKLLQKRPTALADLSWRDFHNWLEAKKIGYDIHHSVWS